MHVPTLIDLNHAIAQRDFYEFARRVSGFKWQDNWHLRYVADKLQAVAEGEIKRLILTIPFRHGKSQLGSRLFPAYVLGRFPDKRVIGTSHSADLAVAMSRDAKRIVASDAYAKIFPRSKLSTTAPLKNVRHAYMNTAAEWDIVGFRGGYYARGTGQAIQGKGGDIIIIDDVFGKREDAYSPRVRQSVKDWYDNDVVSRLSRGGAIVVINTRMHHDDLIGYLLAQEQRHENADRWHVINFPAIKEADGDPDDPREIGEALWPWRMSKERLLAIKETRPDVYWGPYQGHPSPPGGTIVKEDQIQRWEALPGLKGKWLQSWDLRHGGKTPQSSNACGGLWFVPDNEPGNAYLVDLKLGQWDLPETIAVMQACAEDPLWKRATKKLVEDKADGRAVLPLLRDRIPGLVPITPTSDKRTRLEAVSPFFASGNVYIPSDEIAPWAGAYIYELISFPGSAQDDQVDMTSQALSDIFIPTDHDDDDIYAGWLYD